MLPGRWMVLAPVEVMGDDSAQRGAPWQSSAARSHISVPFTFHVALTVLHDRRPGSRFWYPPHFFSSVLSLAQGKFQRNINNLSSEGPSPAWYLPCPRRGYHSLNRSILKNQSQEISSLPLYYPWTLAPKMLEGVEGRDREYRWRAKRVRGLMLCERLSQFFFYCNFLHPLTLDNWQLFGRMRASLAYWSRALKKHLRLFSTEIFVSSRDFEISSAAQCVSCTWKAIIAFNRCATGLLLFKSLILIIPFSLCYFYEYKTKLFSFSIIYELYF